jgi:integrase/recombinase XerD
MEAFRAYLIANGITPGMYINRMCNLLSNYLEWLKVNNLSVETAGYEHLLNFIGYLQKTGKSKFHINRTLQTISHYYRFQQLPDIANTTRLRGVPRTQPQNLLSEEELDKIYEAYEPQADKGYYYHSDKLILGMILYQALDMREFLKIELKDLQLEKGQLYVGESRQKRSRVIPLKANQVLSIHSFILQVRPILIKAESDKLFAPQADNYSLLHWQFKQLSKKVKQQVKEKLEIDIHKLSQLRHSRIALWTKDEGLRKTQYLAGFRRVSSAERYQQANLEDLKKQVQLHHPLQ